YRSIEDAMASVRDTVYQGLADPARARTALANLRSQINAFAASQGVAISPTTTGASTSSAPTAAAAPPPATGGIAAAVAAAGVSPEDCARYSGQAALPYFEYARQLAAGSSPLPGIPPAQAVTPLYGYGPGPAPGMVAAGPFNPVFPYVPRVGPGAVVGGGGV